MTAKLPGGYRRAGWGGGGNFHTHRLVIWLIGQWAKGTKNGEKGYPPPPCPPGTPLFGATISLALCFPPLPEPHPPLCLTPPPPWSKTALSQHPGGGEQDRGLHLGGGEGAGGFRILRTFASVARRRLAPVPAGNRLCGERPAPCFAQTKGIRRGLRLCGMRVVVKVKFYLPPFLLPFRIFPAWKRGEGRGREGLASLACLPCFAQVKRG